MSPKIYGPHLWHVIHVITLAYPDKPSKEDKLNNKIFFESLKNVIPCSLCREHYKQNLKNYPLDEALTSRDKLTRWGFDLHNQVNKDTGKKQFKYEDFIKKYEHMYGINQPQTTVISPIVKIIGGGIGDVASAAIFILFSSFGKKNK